MIDLKCGCNCFGHPKRVHSTLYCKYLKGLMAAQGKVMTSRGQYEAKVKS